MEQISIFDLDDDLPLFKIDRSKPIRLISLFSGYDSQKLAFDYLGINVEHYRTVEFDKYAIQSLNDIHNTNFPVQDITQMRGGYLGIEDTDKYTYVMTYSAPCTDISLAGKRAGMNKESGTRSANIWEVGRLLHECKELPQILIMENVPQIVSERSWKDWVLLLENLGYSNYCQFLNAKNFGIPQNRERCFMVSILGNYNYKSPKGFELKYRLKDFLESNVDESYYLSDKIINFYNNNNVQKEKGNGFRFSPTNGECVAKTITTRAGSRMDDNFINCGNKRLAKTLQDNDIEPNSYIDCYNNNNRKDGCSGTITAGVDFRNSSFVAVSNDKPNIIGKYVKGVFSSGQVVDKNGIAPTFMENHGKVMGAVEEKIIIPEATKQGFAVAGDGVYINRPHQKRGVVQKGMIQTLKTTCADVGVVIGSTQKNAYVGSIDKESPSLTSAMGMGGGHIPMIVKNENVPKVLGGIGEKKSNGGTQWYQQDRIYDNKISMAVTSGFQPNNLVENNQLRIRKLTPLEVFKLMGVKPSDYEKLTVSKSQKYKQAGNSIVTTCLMAIYSQLFDNVDYKKKIDELLEELINK